MRMKEDYDGAEPAAASVTVRNLLSLGHLLGDASFSDRAKRTLERYGPEIGQVVRVMPLMVTLRTPGPSITKWRVRKLASNVRNPAPGPEIVSESEIAI